MIKDMTVLCIDTTDSAKTVVKISKYGFEHTFTEKTGKNKAQNLLPLIKKSLQKQRLKLSDLTAIKVNLGPGSFTGVRVGVSVANILGWTLGIKVNGKKQVHPIYDESKFD